MDFVTHTHSKEGGKYGDHRLIFKRRRERKREREKDEKLMMLNETESRFCSEGEGEKKEHGRRERGTR